MGGDKSVCKSVMLLFCLPPRHGPAQEWKDTNIATQYQALHLLAAISYSTAAHSSFKSCINFTFKTFLTICSGVSFTGVLRGCAGGTWWRPHHRLRVEVLLQLLQLRQGMLLQRPQHPLRNPAGAVLGLRVCHDHLPACVADHALSACLHDQLRLRAEVLRHVSPVLSGSHLWNVWPLLQQHRRQERLVVKQSWIIVYMHMCSCCHKIRPCVFLWLAEDKNNLSLDCNSSVSQYYWSLKSVIKW